MRGFAMGGQQFPQFFAAGSRSSLLGPVPMGVAIKTPHMGFAPLPFNPHARFVNNDYNSRHQDRKREIDHRPAGTSDGQIGGSASKDEGSVAVADAGSEVTNQQVDEPALKKPRTDGLERVAADADKNAEEGYDNAPGHSNPTVCVSLEEVGRASTVPDSDEAQERNSAAEVQSGALPLMTANDDRRDKENGRSQEMEAEPVLEEEKEEQCAAGQEEEVQDKEMEEEECGEQEGREGSNKFYCYICSITCHNQQNFQGHMNGLSHQQRLMEIQHMSNACLVTLLPKVQESLQGTRRDGEKRPGLQRWCATCQTHFTSNVLEHRRTKEHKLCTRASSPCCTVCKVQFRTSREFVEHMETPEHQQKVQELRESKRGEGLEDVRALDEKGCLMGEEESEDREDDWEDKSNGQGAPEVTLEDMTDEEQFDPETIYGSSFLVPVAGFLCRLCNRFYQFESMARHSHCRSRQHFQNLKQYRALRKQEDQTQTEAQEQGSPLEGEAKQSEPAPDPVPLSTTSTTNTTSSRRSRASRVQSEDSQANPATPTSTSNNSIDAVEDNTSVMVEKSSATSEDACTATEDPRQDLVSEVHQRVEEAIVDAPEAITTESLEDEVERKREEPEVELEEVAPTTGRGRARGAGKRKSGRGTRRR